MRRRLRSAGCAYGGGGGGGCLLKIKVILLAELKFLRNDFNCFFLPRANLNILLFSDAQPKNQPINPQGGGG